MPPKGPRVSVQRWDVSRNRKGRTLLRSSKRSLKQEKKMTLTENSHNSRGLVFQPTVRMTVRIGTASRFNHSRRPPNDRTDQSVLF